jgi:hypothetical protein
LIGKVFPGGLITTGSELPVVTVVGLLEETVVPVVGAPVPAELLVGVLCGGNTVLVGVVEVIVGGIGVLSWVGDPPLGLLFPPSPPIGKGCPGIQIIGELSLAAPIVLIGVVDLRASCSCPRAKTAKMANALYFMVVVNSHEAFKTTKAHLQRALRTEM